MKFSLILLLAGSLLISCKQKPAIEPNRVVIHTAPTELTLNGQERWQADAPTNNSMLLMQDLMLEYASFKDNRSAEAYNTLGQVLEEELQLVFRNCTMQGKAHDMLHLYLVPLAEDVRILQGDDVTAATAAYKRIDSRIKQYNSYFQ